MRTKDFVAPREDGTRVIYRAYVDMSPPLVVDAEKAFAVADDLGHFNPSYKWATTLYTIISYALIVGGFVALIWLPWWAPVVGIVLGVTLYRTNKKSCADFVAEIVQQDPEQRSRFLDAGVVREDFPDGMAGSGT
jgi:hypothetical protein